MSQPKLKFNGMISEEKVDVKSMKPKNKRVKAAKVKRRKSSERKIVKSELEVMFEKMKQKKEDAKKQEEVRTITRK